jgi:hypothetical protein
MKVEILPLTAVQPPKWRATSILRPDFLLLKTSMTESGWLQPLVVRLADKSIIDGSERWNIACSDEKFSRKHGETVPVVFHDVDEIDAMILHVRMNRARGFVHPVRLSSVVNKIIVSEKYNERDLAPILSMSDDELELLLTGDLIKKKNLQKYEYSRAWIPVEVASDEEVPSSFIERPPNDDR